MSQKQDPLSKLFDKVKAKVEVLKAAGTTNALDTQSPHISASTPANPYSLENTTENRGQDCLLPNVSQRAKVTAVVHPLLVGNTLLKAAETTNAPHAQSPHISASTPASPNPLENTIENKTQDWLVPNVSQTLEVTADAAPLLVGKNILKAAETNNAPDTQSPHISASTPANSYPLKNTIENRGPNVSQRTEVTADIDPLLVGNRVHKSGDVKKKKKMKKKTTDIKVQTHLEQSNNISPIVGTCPTSFNPVKDPLVQELPNNEKETTTDINIQTPLKQSDNISPIVGSCPTSLYSVKESSVQEPPKYKKKKKRKTTDVNIPTLPEQHDNISPIVECFPTSSNLVKEALVQELPESKKKKTTDIKIQTLPQLSSNSSPIIGCCPHCFNPIKISLVPALQEYENTRLESLPQKQDPISKKGLKKSLEEVKVNTGALEAAGNTNARNIPFYDMSASTPDKAYPIEKIIEKEEWDCLGDLLNLPQGAKLTPDAYPIFVCNRVQKLEDIKDEYEKSRFASVLQYITHLIKYKDKHMVTNNKSVKDHKFPSILEEKFRTMFNESSSERLSCRKRKLLINYVLVLALFVDGYQSNVADLVKDLRTDIIEVEKQYKELGCKFVHEESAIVATLSIPLRFPYLLAGKKRKRD